jgi:hypothetical protein
VSCCENCIARHPDARLRLVRNFVLTSGRWASRRCTLSGQRLKLDCIRLGSVGLGKVRLGWVRLG